MECDCTVVGRAPYPSSHEPYSASKGVRGEYKVHERSNLLAISLPPPELLKECVRNIQGMQSKSGTFHMPIVTTNSHCHQCRMSRKPTEDRCGMPLLPSIEWTSLQASGSLNLARRHEVL
eukprot:1158741-Pelagomonas_calceolata.AAC.2